ncbi:hypothetical protein BJ508DRAFT_378457 [Ascobolus immersus RN42]|uniref:Wbp11/ELF5/Saf1 N-terminal domain-containing protein n=1 Tax=Ascobolus immersus RN42 TaxID=1160509 RepID=A0A3N4HWU6_ASCIM|nr:hypothetical protein BJ508DRAFT_378457 [Ascobolus immersus RN42]
MQSYNASLKKAEKRKHAATREKSRNQKLARRNPHRLERQLHLLTQIPENARKPHEKKQIDELTKEIRLVRKAREAEGIVDPPWEVVSGKRRKQEVGKEKQTGQGAEEDDSGDETEESVRGIPLPPGPLPPLKGEEEKVVVTIEAKPVLRDLRKEATKFVPKVVRQTAGVVETRDVVTEKKVEPERVVKGVEEVRDEELDRFLKEVQMAEAQDDDEEGDEEEQDEEKKGEKTEEK